MRRGAGSGRAVAGARPGGRTSSAQCPPRDQVRFQIIGPAYWEGEMGRLGLIAGTARYDEGGFLAAFQALARWQASAPPDSRQVS